jgi:DNA repair protein Swi5/Sae3
MGRHDPSETVKRHIRLLHDYNEIKDIAQGLMGLIADARGVRQVEVQSEFGVGTGD